MIISAKQLAGTVAMWAIRQSPYRCPDKLVSVLHRIQLRFEPNAPFDFREGSEDEIHLYVSTLLRGIPEYLEWNERKNGNKAEFHFTSRYDAPGDPDDEFIDLDALERNVVNSMRDEQ